MKIPMDDIDEQNGVFLASSWRAMLKKLFWEVSNLESLVELQNRNLESSLGAAYFAFNAAVTAFHLSDWVWAEIASQPYLLEKALSKYSIKPNKRYYHALKNFQDALATHHEEFELCRIIANGSKHAERDREFPLRVSIEWTRYPARAGTLRVGDSLCVYQYKLILLKDGSSSDLIELLRRTIKFWEDTVHDLLELNDRFVMP